MKKARRNFIKITGAALLGSTLQRGQADNAPTPAPDVTAMLQASGFTPGGPNSALLAVIGDIHINQDTSNIYYASRFDDPLVAELNALTPAITDLAIAGDLIFYLSASIGAGRSPQGYGWALQEFQVAKVQMQRFRSNMNLYAVPGNHDTDQIEEDAETWRAQLQIPPYQKTILGGVHVFFLNSGHAGMMNPGQIQWFENEARLIPADQEVLIVAHHPSFFYMFVEIGLKRVVSNVFRKHRAPVWVVGGHGHAFQEGYLESRSGTRFLQMEVTLGHPIQRTRGKLPGYILLALQDGKVIHRSFREVPSSGVPDPGFQVRRPLEQLTSTPLRFPFDSIDYPAAVFEEGFYDRSQHLTGFVGTDLKSHLIWCRNYTVRANLGNARGKVSEFLLAAEFNVGIGAPNCHFSATGLDGSWVAGTFPIPNYQQVYRVPIPQQLRNSTNLHIRVVSQLQGSYDGILINGWGLAADPSTLTGFDKWLSLHYRTILPNGQTSPTAKPPSSSLTILEHFAFNIPLPAGISESPAPLNQTPYPPVPPDPPIKGQPVYSMTFRQVRHFRFARRTAASGPMVSYHVEYSPDMTHWTTLEEEALTVTSLEDGWEEVRCGIISTQAKQTFFRARVTSLSPQSGGSALISSGDLDANGIDDLLQYAFNLNAQNGGLRPYDPARPSNKAGVPIIGTGFERMSRIVYPRMIESANPGVNYRLEQSADLQLWTDIPPAIFTERVLRSTGDWDEVETVIMDSPRRQMFYRVCLETIEVS